MMIAETRRTILKVGTFAAALAVMPGLALAAKTVKRFTNGKRGNFAIGGYDPTAYFARGEAVKGAEDHKVSWEGSEWLFETAESAEKFKAAPDDFAPQFGGYCTFAMSIGKIVASNPEIWRIRDGKLYLFAGAGGGKKFDKGPDAMIEKAQSFWDTLTLVE
ncbi:MAG: YHS domain-containing (seleno)protein [Parvularculaceae bacterium]